jgi:hypothetical protein
MQVLGASLKCSISTLDISINNCIKMAVKSYFRQAPREGVRDAARVNVYVFVR